MANQTGNQHTVYIVAAKRTPIGSFLGALSTVTATTLGTISLKACLNQSQLSASAIDEVFIGNVLSANLGQAPARQVALGANLPNDTPCTTVNKVCASGMKALTIGVQSILAGDNQVVAVGGMENMSLAPSYLNTRTGTKLGNQTLVDGLMKDGLTDAYSQQHMGLAAELCAEEHVISREEQDNYAIESYNRSAAAWKKGLFNDEIVPVAIPQRKGDDVIVSTDEEFSAVRFDKIPALNPVFKKDGTVTAANASTLNDGASMLILASEEAVKKHNLTPLAKIVSYADAALKPEHFTIAPAKALPLALSKANLKLSDIDYFEINEAFSVVSLANQKLLNIPSEKLNSNGGAVSLGHPLGCSGARIVTTLLYILKNKKARYGAAAICNGGGGASALVIENGG